MNEELEFFTKHHKRQYALFEIQELDRILIERRKFFNYYNGNCFILFDSKFGPNKNIPFSLDLHGFTRTPANFALDQFYKFIIKWRLPIVRIIYGKGDVLKEVVFDFFNSIDIIDFEINIGYSDFYFRNADYSIWPVINKKIKYVKDESFKWECPSCGTILNIPLIKNKKVLATCPICKKRFHIFNNEIYILNSCEKCNNNIYILLEASMNRIKCEKCGHVNYYLNGMPTPSFDLVKFTSIIHSNEIKKEIEKYKSYEYDFTFKAPQRNKTIGEGRQECYIATLVYKNSNCMELRVLRKFRDEILCMIYIGRIFCKFYYFFSPKLISLFKKSPLIIKIIRYLLDKIVRIITLKLEGELNNDS